MPYHRSCATSFKWFWSRSVMVFKDLINFAFWYTSSLIRDLKEEQIELLSHLASFYLKPGFRKFSFPNKIIIANPKRACQE